MPLSTAADDGGQTPETPSPPHGRHHRPVPARDLLHRGAADRGHCVSRVRPLQCRHCSDHRADWRELGQEGLRQRQRRRRLSVSARGAAT